MKTKSGKCHFIATLIQTMPDGKVYRFENFRFTTIDPQRYAEQLPKQFPGAKWTASFEDLVNLDG